MTLERLRAIATWAHRFIKDRMAVTVQPRLSS
jgi:hypothetical protein